MTLPSGKYFRAKLSLTSMTFPDAALSASVNWRPALIGIPRTRKYSGLTLRFLAMGGLTGSTFAPSGHVIDPDRNAGAEDLAFGPGRNTENVKIFGSDAAISGDGRLNRVHVPPFRR